MTMTDDYWLASVDILRGVIDKLRRHEGSDATTEERVALDECDRGLAQIENMIRGRRRAEELGAKPCWVCDGSAMVVTRAGFDEWRPAVSCQVCGTTLDPDSLGVRDRTIPKDRYESVEHALITAWNAKFEAHAKEVTEDDVS